jgi:hypothetical protein
MGSKNLRKNGLKIDPKARQKMMPKTGLKMTL